MVPRCSSGIEYKKKDVTARSTWPSWVETFEAFSTTSDKHQVLQMVDVFSYNVKGFKPTLRDLVELFVWLKEDDSDQWFVKNKLHTILFCLHSSLAAVSTNLAPPRRTLHLLAPVGERECVYVWWRKATSRNRRVGEIWKVTETGVVEDLGKIGGENWRTTGGEKKGSFEKQSVWTLMWFDRRAAAPEQKTKKGGMLSLF